MSFVAYTTADAETYPHIVSAWQPVPAAGRSGLTIRFITSDDFPPFNFTDGGGLLTGFNVELARSLCARLKAVCTVQLRPFPLLVETLAAGEADAIIAGIADTPALRERLDFSQPYFRDWGRFTVRIGEGLPARPESLAGHLVAVPAATRYRDYLADFFPDVERVETPDLAAALTLVRDGGADAAFGSAAASVFWLAGPAAHGCCAFLAGSFGETAYVGSGMRIAVARGNLRLKADLDNALAGLDADGVIAELAQRFFPAPLD